MTESNCRTFDASLVNPGNFWKMLSTRPVSVAIVAAEDHNGPAGLLALSTAHVSSAPPSMSVAVGKSTSALSTIVRSRHFAISYLPEEATETAEIFGGRAKVDGKARFDKEKWGRLKTSAPVFNRSVLAIDCMLDRTFEYYETVIIVGVIQAYSLDREYQSLMSYAGGYRPFQA